MSTSNDKLLFIKACEGDRAKVETNIQISTYDYLDDHKTLIIEIILCRDLYTGFHLRNITFTDCIRQ